MSKQEDFGNDKEVASQEYDYQQRGSTATGIDDAGAIPKGTIDPVYEAKARVLNRAACYPLTSRSEAR